MHITDEDFEDFDDDDDFVEEWEKDFEDGFGVEELGEDDLFDEEEEDDLFDESEY